MYIFHNGSPSTLCDTYTPYSSLILATSQKVIRNKPFSIQYFSGKDFVKFAPKSMSSCRAEILFNSNNNLLQEKIRKEIIRLIMEPFLHFYPRHSLTKPRKLVQVCNSSNTVHHQCQQCAVQYSLLQVNQNLDSCCTRLICVFFVRLH